MPGLRLPPWLLSASMMLCDAAESVNGRLYVIGGGWNRCPADRPVSIAVALRMVLTSAPPGQPRLTVRLVDDDGDAVPQQGRAVHAEVPLLLSRQRLDAGEHPVCPDISWIATGPRWIPMPGVHR